MSDESCDALDFGCYLGWLADEISLIFLNIFNSILEGLVYILSLIPVPDFLLNTSFTLPPSIAYYAQTFNISFGIGIIVSAYTFRFLLRRIPFIG